VDVRRTQIRIVHCADAHEPDGGTRLRVIAPDRPSTYRATGDLLALAACGRRRHDFRLIAGVHDAIGFVESIQRMRGPGLALAPTAMAGMDNQWRSDQTISYAPACASAFHVRLHPRCLRVIFDRSTVASCSEESPRLRGIARSISSGFGSVRRHGNVGTPTTH